MRHNTASGSCTLPARLYLKNDAEAATLVIRHGRRAGSSQSPVKPQGSCTPPARAFSRTRPKLCAGSGWLPSRGTLKPSSTSVSCTPTGEGVLKDDAEVVRWYPAGRRPGSRHSAVQSRISCTPVGEGVLKDSVLAHMWCNIAGANGHASRQEGLRDSLERDMTRAEVSRATELARGLYGLGLSGLRAVSRAGIRPVEVCRASLPQGLTPLSLASATIYLHAGIRVASPSRVSNSDGCRCAILDASAMSIWQRYIDRRA